MIDPGTLPDGEEYKAYCRRRWGGDSWTGSLRAAGRQLGEKTAFANWKTWPNTLHANRVLLAADAQGLGGRLTDIICRKLYEEGENVSLRDTVGAAAEEAGVVDGARLAASDEGLDELKAQLKNQLAGGKRVSAAPTFSINDGAYVFSGAQETARWKLILEHFAAGDDDA